MNPAPPNLRISTGCSNSTIETGLHLEQVACALARLCQLLEDYAPSWYTQEDRQSAHAALRALRSYLNLPEAN